MASVNANTRVQLTPTALPTADPSDDAQARSADEVGTPASGFGGGLTSMASSLGSTLTDAASFVGVAKDDDGNLQAGVDPLAFGGFAAVSAGPTALMALAGRTDPLTGATTSYLDRLGATAASNTIRITPTLISAVAGPAIADGVTMIAPNLVKKYTDTKNLKTADEKKQAEKSNQYSKISRAVAGGVVVGLAAGAVFLLKPDLFKKFGAGVTHAIEGSTTFSIGGGSVQKLTGVLDDAAIRATMAAAGNKVADGTAVNILRTVSPMARDAVFSNRLLMAAAGGIGTVALANAAAGETDEGKQKLLWGLTAAAGAATVGATWGIGRLTQGSIRANGGAGGVLAKNQLFWKPNIEWIKKYASTIAPITAVPAGTAASQYFNVVNDFDEITGSRSPFRK
jgi:hypothetical protein